MAATAMNERNRDAASPVRQMTVKILYTFDEQNKTMHLVRIPQVLSVQTFTIEPFSSIGLIDLPTCLQAITKASPELITSTGKDYSIYVYDYSEENIPLVGQGMLSKALKTNFEGPRPSLSSSVQFVTGRISRNTIDIFANGLKETLEVRFRLVPVLISSSQDQTEVVQKVDSRLPRYSSYSSERSASKPMASVTTSSAILLNTTDSQTEVTDPENARRLNVQSQAQPLIFQPSQILTDNSGNESVVKKSSVSKVKKGSRPSSKITNKRPRGRKTKASATRVVGNTSSLEEGTDDENGSVPKKAKLQKSDRNSVSGFGKSSQSLRIVAGTSGPLRLLRPNTLTSNDSISSSNHQKNVSKVHNISSNAPKPGKIDQQSQSKQRLRRNSCLSQGSSKSQLPLKKSADLLQYSIEPVHDSPDRISSPFDTVTPPGLTSSPPLMRSRASSHLRSTPPYLSSPVLPQIPRTDSGFMSGPLEEIYDENKMNTQIEDEACAKQSESRQHTLPVPIKESKEQTKFDFVIEEECPGPMDQLPTTVPNFQYQARARCAVSYTEKVQSENRQKLLPLKKSNRPTTNKCTSENPPTILPPFDSEDLSQPKRPKTVCGGSTSQVWAQSETEALAASSTFNKVSTIPASDPIIPFSSCQCSQIWAGTAKRSEVNSSSIPPMAQYNSLRPLHAGTNSLTLSQSSTKKEMIKQRLETAIANGETPPFCCNCGAIETTTWRIAWSKKMIGDPANCEYSDDQDTVAAKIVLTRDAEGKPTSYHLIIKSQEKDKSQDGYNKYQLCNPCGIYMNKHKTARPEELWESNGDRTSREPRKRSTHRNSKLKKNRNSTPPALALEENFLSSDTNFPLSKITHPSNKEIVHAERSSSCGIVHVPKPFIYEQISQTAKNDAQHTKTHDPVIKTAETYVTQNPTTNTSPARWIGTQESPINIEDDLEDTKRLLLSSLQNEISQKFDDNTIMNAVLSDQNGCFSKDGSLESAHSEEFSPETTNEEADIEILRLFGEEFVKKTSRRVITPTQNPPLINSFETPERQSSKQRSSSRSLSKSGNSNKSPGQLLLSSRTPGSSQKRTSPYLEGTFDSPFTATLNQLISEAHSYSPGQAFDYDSLSNLPETAVEIDLNTNYSLNDFFPPEISHSPSDTNYGVFESTLENITSLAWDNFEGITLDFATPDDPVRVKPEPKSEEIQCLELEETNDEVSDKGSMLKD